MPRASWVTALLAAMVDCAEPGPPKATGPSVIAIASVTTPPARNGAPAAVVESEPLGEVEGRDPTAENRLGNEWEEGGLGSFGSGIGSMGTPGGPPGVAVPGIRQPPPPSLKQGTVTVVGGLPPEVIRWIVRQNFGRFRMCYEKGLRKNPELSGTVVVRYSIDRSGTPGNLTPTGSTLGDPHTIQCVLGAFRDVRYPQPTQGVVQVTFPITFSPGSANANVGSPNTTAGSPNIGGVFAPSKDGGLP